jgi:hypothetical protein
MLHGRQPRVTVICRRRTVDLDPLGVHVHPQQRHVILPTDDRTDATDRRVNSGLRSKTAGKSCTRAARTMLMIPSFLVISDSRAHSTSGWAQLFFGDYSISLEKGSIDFFWAERPAMVMGVFLCVHTYREFAVQFRWVFLHSFGLTHFSSSTHNPLFAALGSASDLR